MPVFHRQLSATLSVALACLCGGCITIKNFQDTPPAQLDPAPPKPIIHALPPIATERATRPASRVAGNSAREVRYAGVATPTPAARSTYPASSGMADLIMGRTTPQPPSPPVMPPQTFPGLGKTNAPVSKPWKKPDTAAGNVTTNAVPTARPAGNATLTNLNFRQIIALQTLLDRRNFSCNCADGKVGSRTHAALRAFQKARGLKITGEPNGETVAALGDLGSAFTSYTITAEDHAQLTQNPTTWLERSQVERLGYQTILEAVAERGHATQQAIRDLNPQVSVWPDPPAGTTLTIPDVSGGDKLEHAARIRISIGGKLIRVFDGAGDQTAQFPCSIARDPKKREPCEISVAVVAPNPNYTFDPALFSEEPESKTIKTKLIIPPGPRNPVGSAWVGLSKTGYGMHGTPKPEDIGKTESHGCFRLANWNAQKLLRMVEIGTPVSVEE